MKKELVVPDFFLEPEGYTRIVKPFADGRTRAERIDWLIANCKKDFRGTIASYDGDITGDDRIQLFYFECEQEAVHFAFVKT